MKFLKTVLINPGMVARAVIPAIQEAHAKELQFNDQYVGDLARPAKYFFFKKYVRGLEWGKTF